MTHAEGGHVRAAHQASQRSSAEKRVALRLGHGDPSLNAFPKTQSVFFFPKSQHKEKNRGGV